jgi:hypothetical protein
MEQLNGTVTLYLIINIADNSIGDLGCKYLPKTQIPINKLGLCTYEVTKAKIISVAWGYFIFPKLAGKNEKNLQQ